MNPIRVACRTHTWEMLGVDWRGDLTDILDAVAEAGYEGIEISTTMIGAFRNRPEALRRELEKRNLRLAALAYARDGFADPHDWDADLAGARNALEFLRRFPEPRLALGGAASPARQNRRRRLANAIVFYHEVGQLARTARVSVNVHPHSLDGSLLETAEECQYMLDRLPPHLVSFGPDTGHIVRGGQDLLSCLRTHVARLTHLHVKDVDRKGNWVPLGEGVCDLRTVVRFLRAVGYTGWVVVADESESVRNDYLAALVRDREYLRSLGC